MRHQLPITIMLGILFKKQPLQKIYQIEISCLLVQPEIFIRTLNIVRKAIETKSIVKAWKLPIQSIQMTRQNYFMDSLSWARSKKAQKLLIVKKKRLNYLRKFLKRIQNILVSCIILFMYTMTQFMQSKD